MSKNIDNMSDEEFDVFMNESISSGEIEEEEIEVDGTEDEGTEEVEDSEEAEQPDDNAESEDSDDNGDEETVEDEDETDEGSEEDDTAIESDEEQPEEEDTESKQVEDQKVPTTYKVRANGMDFDFTPEELTQLASKGMDYTKKMQEIKEYREQISAIKEAKISKDDLNLMIDVLKGDKNAIANVLKKTGVDALDIDTEDSKYVPKNYGRNEVELEIEDIVKDISRDPEYTTTSYIVDNAWDDASRREFVKDPKKIAALHDDVKNGVYDKVAPMALKKKALDGGRKSDIEYYIDAGRDYYTNVARQRQAEQAKLAESARVAKQVQEVKTQESKQSVIKKTADKRKAAAITKPRTVKRSIDDHLSTSMSDDEFSKLMEKAIYKSR